MSIISLQQAQKLLKQNLPFTSSDTGYGTNIGGPHVIFDKQYLYLGTIYEISNILSAYK